MADRLPGWGITFGGFPQSTATHNLLQRSLKLLPSRAQGGQAHAVVTRQYKGFKSYRAVVVGLTSTPASAMCHFLWGRGGYCRAPPPAELNNPEGALALEQIGLSRTS